MKVLLKKRRISLDRFAYNNMSAALSKEAVQPAVRTRYYYRPSQLPNHRTPRLGRWLGVRSRTYHQHHKTFCHSSVLPSEDLPHCTETQAPRICQNYSLPSSETHEHQRAAAGSSSRQHISPCNNNSIPPTMPPKTSYSTACLTMTSRRRHSS